jgi:hypothetical protein
LTLSQSNTLIQSAPGLPELNLKRELEIAIYQQERNYAAHRSHRKCALMLLKRKGRKPK